MQACSGWASRKRRTSSRTVPPPLRTWPDWTRCDSLVSFGSTIVPSPWCWPTVPKRDSTSKRPVARSVQFSSLECNNNFAHLLDVTALYGVGHLSYFFYGLWYHATLYKMRKWSVLGTKRNSFNTLFWRKSIWIDKAVPQELQKLSQNQALSVTFNQKATIFVQKSRHLPDKSTFILLPILYTRVYSQEWLFGFRLHFYFNFRTPIFGRKKYKFTRLDSSYF